MGLREYKQNSLLHACMFQNDHQKTLIAGHWEKKCFQLVTVTHYIQFTYLL